MKNEISKKLFERANQSIPGGVNSPVRAFKSVGGTPLFIKKAKGCYLFDEDGNKYVDLICSWGPMILGHAPRQVISKLKKQLKYSTSYGAPTLLEIEMAELVKDMCPGVDMIRMVSSGTEACMSALRLARGYTGKNKFIKFEGHYHGHADPFLVSAGSGLATLQIQSVPGVAASVSNDTLVCPFNDFAAVQQMVEANAGEIAAIILEPVAGNMGCVPPTAGFLQALRSLCNEKNIVLIFDEVMTGFRVAKGGVQELYNVQADLVTYGKVIGGGLPVGAFGGKQEIMNHIAPLGKVYQAGTLSGNPIALTAGLATLQQLHKHPDIYHELEQKGAYLKQELQKVFDTAQTPVAINQVGSMISVHYTDGPVSNFADAKNCDLQKFNAYFHFMLERGIYLPPSAFESWFLSTEIKAKEMKAIIKGTKAFLYQ